MAGALAGLLEARATGDYNIGTGLGTTIREVADLIAEVAGSPSGAVQEATLARADPYPYVVADSTRLRSLGWQPMVTLNRGLAQLVAGLRR